jgi:hypothetical protein
MQLLNLRQRGRHFSGALATLRSRPAIRKPAEGILAGDQGVYPKFLGIGAQKAGTTWLHQMLSQHQEIWLPHVKELHYFDRKFPIGGANAETAPARKSGVLSKNLSARFRRLTAAKLLERLRFRRLPDLAWEARYLLGDWSDEWYASLFAHTQGRLPGEITPAYSALSDAAISHVHSLMPGAKLILLLRDPIERAWSHARMDLAQSLGRDVGSIPEAEFLAHFTGIASRRRGSYPGIVDRWLSRYPERQLFVGFYDDIESSPGELLTEIFRFLEVSADKAHIPPTVHVRVNAGARERIPESLHRRLAELYVDDLRELARRYGSRPQGWLARCESVLAGSGIGH